MDDGAGRDEVLVERAAQVGALLLESGSTVATAESCTGGLVGHVLTEIAGSSRYYLGGSVSYSDRLKEQLLGVPPELIVAQGAVSEAVARAMAEGARRLFGADVAVSVTGIAGPGGGTATKPVGLTWVAVADGQGTVMRSHVWPGDRSANKRHSALAVLDLLVERLTATR